MREGGRHMALVREPNGNVVGITTLDDSSGVWWG